MLLLRFSVLESTASVWQWKLMCPCASLALVGLAAPLCSPFLEDENSVCTDQVDTYSTKGWFSEVLIDACDRVVIMLEHNLGCRGIGPFSSGYSEGPSSRLWNHAAVSGVRGRDVHVGDSLSVVGGARGSESTVRCPWLFLHFPSGRAGQCTAHQTVTNATGFLQIEPRRMGALGSLCVHTAGGWARHEP